MTDEANRYRCVWDRESRSFVTILVAFHESQGVAGDRCGLCDCQMVVFVASAISAMLLKISAYSVVNA